MLPVSWKSPLGSLSTMLPKKRNTPIRNRTSFSRASATGLPFSSDRRSASSSACASRTAAQESSNPARSVRSRHRQSRINAWCADSAAAFICAAPPPWTTVMTLPVAGFSTENLSASSSEDQRYRVSSARAGTAICPPSGHVLLEPLEHRPRATLKLQVAVPPCRGAADPFEPLVGDRDVVEHRLHIARFGQHVVMHLIEERRYADVFRPFLWGPRFEPDTRTQDEPLFQILDAISRDSGQCQSTRHDDLHRDRLRADEAAHPVKGAPILRHGAERRAAAQAPTEETDRHMSRVASLTNVPGASRGRRETGRCRWRQ